MSAEPALYFDASALVKLIIPEPESGALEQYLRQRAARRVSCALAIVEITRAARPHGIAAVARAQRAIDAIDLLPLDDALLREAALLGAPVLRTLDAIHLAGARALGPSLTAVVTYDTRMARAARALGLLVESPARDA